MPKTHSVTVPDNLVALTNEERRELYDEVVAVAASLDSVAQALNALLSAQQVVTSQILAYLAIRDGAQPMVPSPGRELSASDFPEWVEPLGYDTYPQGYMVRRDWEVYRSLVDSNAYTPFPESQFWEHLTPDQLNGVAPTDPTSGVQVWVPDHDYQPGDEAAWGGSVWRSLQAHVSQTGWEPSAVTSSLWERVR